MGPKSAKTLIYDLKPGDKIILHDNPKTGVTLRDDIGDNPGRSIGGGDCQLSEAQIVCLALNEEARVHGDGKFFWIPERRTRAAAKDYGLCRSGADLVFIPWVWSDVDNHLYDEATPYERLKMTNAWACLPGKTIVLPMFNHYKSKPTVSTPLPIPRSKGVDLVPYQLGTVSLLLLWDEFPNMVLREHITIKGNNQPNITANHRRQHRVHSMQGVITKVIKVWNMKAPDGRFSKRVSMEEVYADALEPGNRKNNVLARITWRRGTTQASQQSIASAFQTS